MSIVAAMKLNDRIIVMSDTMISDPNGTANNIVPGRLKSVVINEWLTISYAGLSTQGIDVIKAINKLPDICTDAAVTILIDASKTYHDELDFILCSHEASARLIKISRGSTFEGADGYWIGSQQAAIELSKIEVPPMTFNDLPEYVSPREILFTTAFSNFLRDGRCKGVGGAAINCLCSKYGHCYQTNAGAFSWDTIIIGQDDYEKRQELNKTGTYHYEYNVCSTSVRGKAVVGFYLGQCNVGYLYDPLHSDDAMVIKNMNLEDFVELRDYAGTVLARGNLHKKMELPADH
jgi:hypothetical protein